MSGMPLEELNRTLVLFRGSKGRESSEISSALSLGINLSAVQSILAAAQFADHVADFNFGTLFPALRASDSPIAMACLRLFTVLPDLPLLSVPLLRFLIALFTFFAAALPYLLAMIAPSVETGFVGRMGNDGRPNAEVKGTSGAGFCARSPTSFFGMSGARFSHP
jgi:hypothetical protein